MIRKKNLRIGYANFMTELMAAAFSEWQKGEKKREKWKNKRNEFRYVSLSLSSVIATLRKRNDVFSCAQLSAWCGSDRSGIRIVNQRPIEFRKWTDPPTDHPIRPTKRQNSIGQVNLRKIFC